MGLSLELPSDLRKIVVFRSFVGLAGFLCMGYGIWLLPLVLNTILFNTAPFWMSLMSYMFLGEALTPFQIVSLFVCFSCVVVIAVS